MGNYSRKDIAGITFFAMSVLALCYMILSPLNHVIVHYDEYFTLTLLNLPVMDMITITAGDVHPPLYYLMAEVFVNITKPLGWDLLFSLKILSVIPYFIILILSATKIRKDFSWFTAGLFSLSLAIMTEFFSHFVRARMYSWAILFVILAFVAFMDVIEKEDRKSWILLTIFSILCAYTQYFAAITAGSIYLILLIYLVKFKKEKIRTWVLSVMAAAILYIPWVFTLISQLETVHHTYWIPGITLSTIINALGYFAYNNDLVFSAAAAIILAVIIFIYSKETENADEKNRFFTLSGIMIYLGTIILSIIISVVFRPILVIRYLIPASAILWLTISIILSRIENRKMFLISMGLILILLISGLSTTISTNDDLYKNGVAQKEVLDNITQDSNSVLIVSNPHLIMYFLHLSNLTDMYCLNIAQLFGENMTRLHQVFDFKTYNGNDINKITANNTDKKVYIISWNDPVLNSSTVQIDKRGNIVFSKVTPTNATLTTNS